MIRATKNAILARLRADAVLAGVTFEGVVEDRPELYCSVFINSGYRTSERFTGPAVTAEFTFTIHSVGTSQDQAQFVAERVFAQLLDFSPTIAGRTARRLRHVVSRPAELDRDVTPPLWFVVDQFDLTTDPA